MPGQEVHKPQSQL